MVITSKELSWWRIYLYVIITYIISHGLMLLVYGAWWDDWEQWNVSDSKLYGFLGPDNFNHPIMYFIIHNIAIIKDKEVMMLAYRLIPFVCWLVSTLSFVQVIKKITNDKSFVLGSSLLVASSGINKCIFLICCYHYTISIALFMLGLVAFANDYYKESLFYKITAAVLWFLSLVVWRSAVLVVPALVIYASVAKLGLAWREFKTSKAYKSLLLYIIKHNASIIIGIVFFAILYLTVLAPGSSYSDYYSISIKNVILAPITLITSSFSLIIGYLSNILNVFAYAGNKIVFLFPLLLIPLVFLRNSSFKEISSRKLIIMVSFVFLLSSNAPHVLRSVSFAFALNGYDSRVASLSIYPLAIIISYLVYMMPQKYRKYAFMFLISSSISYTIVMYADFNREWARNEAVVEIFEQNKYLDGKNIKVTNRALEYSNFICEDDRYYDYEGCARLAYGVDTKTKCISYYDEATPFEADYYLFIDKRRYLSLNGSMDYFIYNIKLFVCRISDKSEYIKMVDDMLQYRIIRAVDFKYLNE